MKNRDKIYKERIAQWERDVREHEKKRPPRSNPSARVKWHQSSPPHPDYIDAQTLPQSYKFKSVYEDDYYEASGKASDICIRIRYLLELDKPKHIPELIKAYHLLNTICSMHEEVYHEAILELNNAYYYLLEFNAIPIAKGIYTDMSHVGKRASEWKGTEA